MREFGATRGRVGRKSGITADKLFDIANAKMRAGTAHREIWLLTESRTIRISVGREKCGFCPFIRSFEI
jgi:hypothetical protein